MPVQLATTRTIDERQCSSAGIEAGKLDAEDLARVLTGFRGQPRRRTPPMRYARCASDEETTAYVFDEESGMVYILD